MTSATKADQRARDEQQKRCITAQQQTLAQKTVGFCEAISTPRQSEHQNKLNFGVVTSIDREKETHQQWEAEAGSTFRRYVRWYIQEYSFYYASPRSMVDFDVDVDVDVDVDFDVDVDDG